MGFVPEADREAKLSALGVSKAVVALGSGTVEPLFEPHCQPPYYCYQGAKAPSGVDVIPLWEDGVVVYAVRETDGGAEFVSLSLELPDSITVLATTEQGLLSQLFMKVIELEEDEEDFEQVRRAAQSVGFQHLDETLRHCGEAPEDRLSFSRSL